MGYNIAMDLINYLVNIYGYDTPIFLKDIRIGRKSKAAIKEEFYRATKKGLIKRKTNGIYYLKSDKEFGNGINFYDVIEQKYIYSSSIDWEAKELFVEGYYSGLTFLNQIGISEQVPAIPEITTNRTSSKKRYYVSMGSIAIVRKAKTQVTFLNYKILQFLDMFHFLTMDEVKENKQLIIKYVKDNCFSKYQFKEYIGLYGTETIKKIVEGCIINAFI